MTIKPLTHVSVRLVPNGGFVYVHVSVPDARNTIGIKGFSTRYSLN